MSTLLCLPSERLQKYWRYTKKLLLHGCVSSTSWLCTKTHKELFITHLLTLLAQIHQNPRTRKLNNNNVCEVPQYLGDLSGDEVDSSSYENLK